MKKYLLIATIALGLSLVACSGGKKAETAPADNSSTPAMTTPDTTAPADSVVAPVDSVAPVAK